MTTRELLSKLVSFDTISANSNRELMDFIVSWLQQHSIKSQLIPNANGSKANLYATVLPTAVAHRDKPGIVLSGHTDVVPIEGQDWTVPAFSMTERNSRYYGRGTTDMKGFVACALTALANANTRQLTMPLHLALSYDEEIGCVGVRSLIDMLAQYQVQPRLCIVGEPTMMMVATRHKGKCAVRAHFTGREGHSALAPHNLNAIHLACDFVTRLQALQATLAEPYKHSDSTEIPYTTVHAGIIKGGTALNIVPNHCSVDFEIRNASEDNATQILDTIMEQTQRNIAVHQHQFPEASVTFDIINEYPGLNTREDTWAVEFMKSLTGANDCTEVAFGTEAGLFSSILSIPSVVCGPGSMAQGHKPDEYIEIEQMTQCETVLQRLLDRMCETTKSTGQ